MTRAAYMKRVRDRIKKKAENDKPKLHVMTKRDKPLTSEYELKKTRQEINATNRRRAKEMERRVARYLKGMRVPASGALAGMKGDCKIPLADGEQHYYVECKMSAQNSFPLTIQWFDKVLTDTVAMNSRFGILVIHFHGKKQDYVFVPSRAMSFLAPRSIHGLTIDLIRNDVIAKDITLAGNKMRRVLSLHEESLVQSFVTIRGFRTTAFLMESGVWYVFTLEQFRDLMEGV